MRQDYRLFCPKQNKYKSHEQLKWEDSVFFAARVVCLDRVFFFFSDEDPFDVLFD